ncbi:hypothetical protein AB0M05_00165 [Streptomyces violaceusniger]
MTPCTRFELINVLDAASIRMVAEVVNDMQTAKRGGTPHADGR